MAKRDRSFDIVSEWQKLAESELRGKPIKSLEAAIFRPSRAGISEAR